MGVLYVLGALVKSVASLRHRPAQKEIQEFFGHHLTQHPPSHNWPMVALVYPLDDIAITVDGCREGHPPHDKLLDKIRMHVVTAEGLLPLIHAVIVWARDNPILESIPVSDFSEGDAQKLLAETTEETLVQFMYAMKDAANSLFALRDASIPNLNGGWTSAVTSSMCYMDDGPFNGARKFIALLDQTIDAVESVKRGYNEAHYAVVALVHLTRAVKSIFKNNYVDDDWTLQTPPSVLKNCWHEKVARSEWRVPLTSGLRLVIVDVDRDERSTRDARPAHAAVFPWPHDVSEDSFLEFLKRQVDVLCSPTYAKAAWSQCDDVDVTVKLRPSRHVCVVTEVKKVR